MIEFRNIFVMCQEIWREPLKIKQPAFILYVSFALTFTNRLKWEKISKKRINVDENQWQTWQNLHVVTITLPPTPIMRAFFSGMAAKILHIVKNV